MAKRRSQDGPAGLDGIGESPKGVALSEEATLKALAGVEAVPDMSVMAEAARVAEEISATSAIDVSGLTRVAEEESVEDVRESFVTWFVELPDEQKFDALRVLVDLSSRAFREVLPPWEALMAELDVLLALRGALARVRKLAAGGPVADMLILMEESATEDERVEAGARLAGTHLSRGYVFHPSRWSQLERAFGIWRGGRPFADAWHDLVVPNCIVAYGDMLKDLPVGEAYRRLRRAVARAIEQELLGRTLDAGDPVRKLAAEPPTPEDILENAEMRVDVLLQLRRLPAEEADMLESYYSGADTKGVARRLGITDAALRKRVERSINKLRR